jgi:hypothetical protein
MEPHSRIDVGICTIGIFQTSYNACDGAFLTGLVDSPISTVE